MRRFAVGTAPRSNSGQDPDRNPAGMPAGWAPVRAPYSSLRAGLAEAEQRLNPGQAVLDEKSAQRWRRLHHAAGDETACVEAINDLLAAVPGGWQLAALEGGRRRVHLVPAAHVEPAELAAVQALVLLVEAGGWSRLGRCARPGCPRVFVDITSGGNRRTCRAHDRSRRVRQADSAADDDR
jgi:hypothetical protein